LAKSSVDSPQAPRKELVKVIFEVLGSGRMYLGEITLKMSPKLEFTWEEFRTVALKVITLDYRPLGLMPGKKDTRSAHPADVG
jgi:hypothetical protein